MRALAFARATRPDILEAVTVNVDPHETANLAREWEDREIPVPLKVIDSPFREITKPILDYVKRIRKDSPRDVVSVYLPEYVVGHWWEQVLHNQSALRLKGRLLFTPGRHGHLGALAAVQLRAGRAAHPGTRRPGDLDGRSSVRGQPTGADGRVPGGAAGDDQRRAKSTRRRSSRTGRQIRA